VRVQFDVPRISASRQIQSPINDHSPFVLPSFLKKENNSYETSMLCARAHVCCLSCLEFTVSTFEFSLFSGHLVYVPFDDSLTLQFLNSYECGILGFIFDYISCTYSFVMDWLYNKSRQRKFLQSAVTWRPRGQVVKGEQHWAYGNTLVRGNISSKKARIYYHRHLIYAVHKRMTCLLWSVSIYLAVWEPEDLGYSMFMTADCLRLYTFLQVTVSSLTLGR
jgi:hypothetical protein